MGIGNSIAEGGSGQSGSTAETTSRNCRGQPYPYCALGDVAARLATSSGFDDRALSHVDAVTLQSTIDRHGDYTWQPPTITQSGPTCQEESDYRNNDCISKNNNQKRIHVGCFRETEGGIFSKVSSGVESVEECQRLAILNGDNYPYMGMQNGGRCYYGRKASSFSEGGKSSSCKTGGKGGDMRHDIYVIGNAESGNTYVRVYEKPNSESLQGKNVVLGSGIYSWREIKERSPEGKPGAFALGPHTKMTIWEITSRTVQNSCNCSEMILPDGTVNPDTVVGLSFE